MPLAKEITSLQKDKNGMIFIQKKGLSFLISHYSFIWLESSHTYRWEPRGGARTQLSCTQPTSIPSGFQVKDGWISCALLSQLSVLLGRLYSAL